MKKWFLTIVVALGLVGCSQNIVPNDRGFSPAPVQRVELGTSERITIRDLGAVQAEIHNTYTLTTLKPGYRSAKVKWSAHNGTTVGFDNITPSNSPDRINLGSDDGIVIEVVEAVPQR